MTALVTGAGGFLGRYLVEQLVAAGTSVRAVGRGSYPYLEQLGVDVRRVDLRDREATLAACQGVEIVYHVAGVAGIWGRWDEYYQSNTKATEHIVEGCLKHGVPRLVYTSSPSVTFAASDQRGIDESAPYPARWLCHYAHTKALAEQSVLAASGRSGLATCSLRPHLIWGPRDNQLIPRLLERQRQGRLRRIGPGGNRIDTVYVEDAARAHLCAAAALERGAAAGKAYFISQGAPVDCWSWIDEILELAGLPKVNKAIGYGAAWNVGLACEGLYSLFRLRSEPPMTRFLAAQLATSHHYDISAARRDLGYQPLVSQEEGMRRLGEWLRANGHKT